MPHNMLMACKRTYPPAAFARSPVGHLSG